MAYRLARLLNDAHVVGACAVIVLHAGDRAAGGAEIEPHREIGAGIDGRGASPQPGAKTRSSARQSVVFMVRL